MMQESEIRQMKSQLINAIEYENKLISSKQKEIDEAKERINNLHGRLKSDFMGSTKKWKKYEHKNGLSKRVIDEEMKQDLKNDKKCLNK